jgi:hypothetical protein
MILAVKPRGIGIGPAAWVQLQLGMAILSRSAGIRRKVANAADHAAYFEWKHENFGNVKDTLTKPALWKQISARMRASEERWHVLEFGVAFGHATEWWLSHHDETIIATWDGFDRFTGLPHAWRDLPAGAFSADGQPPDLDDKRITWHVGDLEDTIGEMEAEHIASGRRLAYFDLDLYDPSKVAWEWIRPHLRPGDILYFDEAFDADERRLLDESVLPAGSYDYIGATVMNLAIEVRSLR